MKPSIKSQVKLVVERVSREGFRISSASFWTDLIWRMDNPSPGQRNHIGWHFSLPDGTWSTDSENYELLESFREVVWGMLTDGGWYGRTFKPGTVNVLGAGARPLFRWMNFRELSSFGELTLEMQRLYVDEMPLQIVRGGDFFHSDGDQYDDTDDYASDSDEGRAEDDAGVGQSEESDDPEDDDDDESGNDNEGGEEADQAVGDFNSSLSEDKADDGATYGQVNIRVNFIYAIYAQGHSLKQRGFGFLSALPFDGRKVRDVVKQIAVHTYSKTPPLPDEVTLPLLQAAITWVDNRAPDVLALQELYFNKLNEGVESGLSLARASHMARLELLTFKFSDDPATGVPWREQLKVTQTFSYPQNQSVRSDPTTAMRYFIMRSRDAAVTLLQFLVGFRPSEICGLQGGTNKVTGLPSCIVVRHSASGLLELFYAKSILSKGVDQPQEREWLLGCRPAGATWLPLTVRCMILLERFFSPWRALGKTSALLVTFSTPRGIPASAEGIGRVTTPGLARSFGIFIFTQVDLSGLPDESVRGERLVEYRRRKGLNVSPRYGRKTFAAFMLETRASLLHAVKDHFKHMTVATTENAYFPQDARMRSDVNSVVNSDTIAFFAEAVKGKKMVGRMAPVLEKYFGSNEFRNVKDAAELDRRVSHVVLTHDLRIFFHDHGKCLIKADPLGSRCREVTGTANWNNLIPDFSVRTPGMCAGCKVFAADRSNRPFWERRLVQYTAAFEHAKRRSHEREYRVHLARAEQAAQVIKMFNGVTDDE